MKYHFDDYLESVSAEKLHCMIRLWGAKPPMRKAMCIQTISEGLAAPARVENAIASLDPFERNALSLIKQAGGEMDHTSLALALIAMGMTIPKIGYGYSNSLFDVVPELLIRRGLALVNNSYDPSHISSFGSGRSTIFSDERLLSKVSGVTYETLTLPSAQTPASAIFRRTQSVLLDVMDLLHAIDNMDGLPLTKTGTIRVSSIGKLIKTLGWKKEALMIDGLRFPKPVEAFTGVLRLSGLLQTDDKKMKPVESVSKITSSHHIDLIAGLLKGFTTTADWSETEHIRIYLTDKLTQGRQALIAILKCLPIDSDEFYTLDDLSQALFERIGEHFSIDNHNDRWMPHWQMSSQEKKQAEAARRVELRTAWDQRERLWIEDALTTWLYYLGVVELGFDGSTPISMRLTHLGRAVLHPETDFSLDIVSDTSEPAWTIQPNFEMVVYLDRATPDQLHFLARHTERVSLQEHTAHYKLTRTSVYHGLESGTTIDAVLNDLQTGSRKDLPQNVATEIKDWAGRREQITLRHRAHIVSFYNTEARQQAIKDGLKGIEVGDRFLLLTGSPPAAIRKQSIDYTAEPIRCLKVDEEGIIQLVDSSDLLIAAKLDQWAEREGEGVWRLTENSVRAAAHPKSRVKELLTLLDHRSIESIPPLLRVTLENWAGAPRVAELANVSLFRCTDLDAFQAISRSIRLKPYIKGVLSPGLLLIDSNQTKQFQEVLSWAGVVISDKIKETDAG